MAEPAGTGAAFANVLRRELRAAWRGALGWGLPTAAMVAMTLALQPEMAKKGSLFEQKMEVMPQAVLVAFGIAAKNLADPVYYAATNFTLIELLGAAFAALLGSSLLAKEEAFGTAELLFALPVARRTVVLGKVAAGLGLVVAFDALLMVVALSTYAAIGVTLTDPAAMVGLFVAAAALHAALFGLALLAGAWTSRPRAATSLGLALVFGLYGVSVVGALNASLGWLRALSPFHYAEPLRVIEGGATGGLVGLVAVVVGSIAAASLLFERRDIHA